MNHSEAGKLGAAITSPRLRALARERYYLNPNRCLYCDSVIEVREGEQPATTRGRKFCGHSCAASYNNKLKPKRTKLDHRREVPGVCLVCGANFVGRAQRKFCGAACGCLARRKSVGVHDDISQAAARASLIRDNGAKCSKCGWDELNPVSKKCPIVLNHIDGDSRNMSANNLELLCPNCDSLTPTYKALNRGKGRFERRQRFRDGKSY